MRDLINFEKVKKQINRALWTLFVLGVTTGFVCSTSGCNNAKENQSDNPKGANLSSENKENNSLFKGEEQDINIDGETFTTDPEELLPSPTAEPTPAPTATTTLTAESTSTPNPETTSKDEQIKKPVNEDAVEASPKPTEEDNVDAKDKNKDVVPTETPIIEETVVVTKPPVIDDKPVVTEPPVKEDKPVVTDAPVVTPDPTPAQTPQPTQEPKPESTQEPEPAVTPAPTLTPITELTPEIIKRLQAYPYNFGEPLENCGFNDTNEEYPTFHEKILEWFYNDLVRFKDNQKFLTDTNLTYASIVDIYVVRGVLQTTLPDGTIEEQWVEYGFEYADYLKGEGPKIYFIFKYILS